LTESKEINNERKEVKGEILCRRLDVDKVYRIRVEVKFFVVKWSHRDVLYDLWTEEEEWWWRIQCNIKSKWKKICERR